MTGMLITRKGSVTVLRRSSLHLRAAPHAFRSLAFNPQLGVSEVMRRSFHSSPVAQDTWMPWGKGDESTTKRLGSEWERRLGGSDHRFPEWIEHWNKDAYMKVGYVGTALSGFAATVYAPSIASLVILAPISFYWVVGFRDMAQKKHAVRRNFPFLGNFRYLFESIRPEIRQYFVESDGEAAPFNRENRSIVYQRAKNQTDTLPFGTRRDVYETGYEWANHSMWPKVVPAENQRVTIGGKDCKQPYSSALLNVSAMSYGALSDNAILSLSTGAKMGAFSHNTGEGGVSPFHLEGGADIVWNVGTGYFGCRTLDGKFSPEAFAKQASHPHVKMIEIKLSQGAKPAHGGILPASKLTPEIAEIRGVRMGEDCVSPPTHSAFEGPKGLLQFVQQLRDLSGGKPVGFKLCIGRPEEFAAIVHAMVESGITPDFITVDGAEGGTGAAPAEFSNRIGTPLTEGLRIVDMILTGAGVRDQVKIIASGKVLSGFSLVRLLALGADVCNSARAMMFSLGCIQALKCNNNTCPTGIATQDKRLMNGLDVEDKSRRVASFQTKTVHSALEIIGAIGLDHPKDLRPAHIIRRVSSTEVMSYSNRYGRVEPGAFLRERREGEREIPVAIQRMWANGAALLKEHSSA